MPTTEPWLRQEFARTKKKYMFLVKWPALWAFGDKLAKEFWWWPNMVERRGLVVSCLVEGGRSG